MIFIYLKPDFNKSLQLATGMAILLTLKYSESKAGLDPSTKLNK